MVREADRVARTESGKIRGATTCRLWSPPGFTRSHTSGRKDRPTDGAPRHAGPPPPQGTGSGRYLRLSLLQRRQVVDTGRSLSLAEAGGQHDGGTARESIIRAAGISPPDWTKRVVVLGSPDSASICLPG
jgi:hypothetical protein